MTIYDEDGIRLYHGDALAVLATLPAESVDCVVTSPPYWSLRKYSGEAPEWAPEGYGLEPTPDLYVEHTITVLRAIRRVLKPSGVVWWNIGDGYAGSWGNYGGSDRTAGKQRAIFSGSHAPNAAYAGLEDWRPPNSAVSGLKPKDMICMPWRVGLAAQADGWWLRSDIIWSKPNPMPESVTDRPTKSHEYVLLLAKSERYYFDQDAVAEASTYAGEQAGICRGTKRRAIAMGREPSGNERIGSNWIEPATRNIRSVWTIPTQSSPLPHFASFPEELAERCIKAGCPTGGVVLDPFAGTGTTLKVARELDRQAIGIELSAEYCELAVRRLRYGIKGVQAISAGQLELEAGV